MFGLRTARSSKIWSRPCSARGAPVICAVQLADHHGAAAAVMHHAGLQVVRAEIDEAAQHLRPAGMCLGDDQRIEPVLGRDDEAVRGEVGREGLGRGRGVLRLDAQQDGVPLPVQRRRG